MLKLNQPIENIVLKHNTGVFLCFSKNTRSKCVRARFHYERGKDYSLFVLFIFLLCLALTSILSAKISIKVTKNAFFQAHGENVALHKHLCSDKNQVSLLIKAKVFNFFPLICYKKKAETFISVNVKRSKIQTMGRKHANSDQAQKVVGLITDEPSAIFLLQQNRAGRARFSKYPKKLILPDRGRF